MRKGNKMLNNNYIDSSAKLINSEVGQNLKLYQECEIRNSGLGDYVQVGDDSIILETNLMGNNAINRRNFLFKTDMGVYTYTGLNTVIKEAKIGNFCSISWNCSIGGKNHNFENVTNSSLWSYYNMDGNKPENLHMPAPPPPVYNKK